MDTESVRVQKLLATIGLASRRRVEEWIVAGRITVNGQPIKLGDRACLNDRICLDGQPLDLTAARPAPRQVVMYHKPLGEVSTRSDPQNRPTVFERLPALETGRWVLVGRLDVMTTGLLLFTTDGELAHRLMHPSSRLEREYLVTVLGHPTMGKLEHLHVGLMLEDGYARFEGLQTISQDDTSTTLKVMLREGRNREVRRLWGAVGHEVSELHRLRYGPIRLPQELRPGTWRYLTEDEMERLAAAAFKTPENVAGQGG